MTGVGFVIDAGGRLINHGDGNHLPPRYLLPFADQVPHAPF